MPPPPPILADASTAPTDLTPTCDIPTQSNRGRVLL